MISRRPDNSMHVSTTFAFTDSPTPRKLISPRSRMKTPATAHVGSVTNCRRYVSPNATAAVAAEVTPDAITVNVTMKVRKLIPNALCV
jgi:hypothetical protein